MTEKTKRALLATLGLVLCFIGGCISEYSILGTMVLIVLGTHLYFEYI